MNRYPWFRLYAEARTDAKLRTLTDAQFRVWFNLLCYASEQEERGTIPPTDAFLLAVEVASGDEELLAETLHRLAALRMISTTLAEGAVTFSKFTERQYDKPSDTPDATRERKARQRAKERETGVTNEKSRPLSRDVTPSHAPEKIRGEKSKEEERENVSPQAATGVAAAPRQTRPAPTPLRPAPKPKDAPPKERERDLLFEAVCDACLIDWHQLTDRERGKVNVATGQIRKAGGTPEDIPNHAANYRATYTTPLTPMALAGNWAATANAPPANLNGHGRKETLWDRNERAMQEAFGDEPADVPTVIEATWRRN